MIVIELVRSPCRFLRILATFSGRFLRKYRLGVDLMLVHLVRHGEVHNPDGLVYGALTGFDLSDKGRRQAREAARYLADDPVSAVLSSPLQRALRTAEMIAIAHHLPVRVVADLIEWRLDSWTGIPWAELTTQRPGQLEAYLADPTSLPFLAESLDDLARRVATVITATAADALGDVVVVAHQDPLQAARLHLTGQSLSRQHEDRPSHASIITLEPGEPWIEVGHWKPSE